MARVAITVSFDYEQTGYVATTSGGSPTTQATILTPAAGTTVTVTDTNTNNPATVYTASTGSSTLTTITTDAGGNVPGWVNEGSYKFVAAPSGSFGGDTVYWQAVRGDGASLLAANSVGTSQIQTGAITLALLSSAVAQGLLPVGTILDYGGLSLPSGFIFANGAAISQTTYAALYGVYGNQFNTGGESVGTFRVPDLRQRFVLGIAASGRGHVLGETGGDIDHTHGVQLTIPPLNINGHRFSVTIPAHSHPLNEQGGAQLFIQPGINASGNVQLNIFSDLTGPINNFSGYHAQGVLSPQYQFIHSAQSQDTVALCGETSSNIDFDFSGETDGQIVSSFLSEHGDSESENPPYIALNKIIKY